MPADESATPPPAQKPRTYNIVLQHDETEGVLEKVVKILSYVAIPVVIAVGGWVYSEAQQKREIDQKHLELAIDILSTQEKFDRGNLRGWAVSVLETTSPDGVAIPQEMAQSLRDGIAFLPVKTNFNSTTILDSQSNASEYAVGFSGSIAAQNKTLRAINSYLALTRNFNSEQEIMALDRPAQQQFLAVANVLRLERDRVAVDRFGRNAVNSFREFKQNDVALPESFTEETVKELKSFFETRL